MKVFLCIIFALFLSTYQQTNTRFINSGGYVDYSYSTTYSSVSFTVDVTSGSSVNIYLFDRTNYNNYINTRNVGSTLISRTGYSSTNSRASGTYSTSSTIAGGVFIVVENRGLTTAQVTITQTGTTGSSGPSIVDTTIIIYIVVFVIFGILCLPCILIGAILSAVSPFIPFIIIAIIIVIVLKQQNNNQTVQAQGGPVPDQNMYPQTYGQPQPTVVYQ